MTIIRMECGCGAAVEVNNGTGGSEPLFSSEITILERFEVAHPGCAPLKTGLLGLADLEGDNCDDCGAEAVSICSTCGEALCETCNNHGETGHFDIGGGTPTPRDEKPGMDVPPPCPS